MLPERGARQWRVGVLRLPPRLRADAVAWCERLAADRKQTAWSIRFTHADIELSPATRLAWKVHCAAKARMPTAPPATIWAEAATLLRSGWGEPLTRVALVKSYTMEMKEGRMAKKQTRRSISISGSAYARAKAFADKKGLSLAQFTEAALLHAVEHFDRVETGHA